MVPNQSHAESYFGVPLHQVTEDHLKSLVERKVEESPTLEFKRFEVLRKNPEKIGCNISALANSDGGLLIIGMNEDKEERSFEIDWGIAKDYSKDHVEDILFRKVQSRPRLNCQPVPKKDNPENVVYVVEIQYSDRLIYFDGRPYQRTGSKTLVMEPYQIEAAYGVRRRPYLELKLYQFKGIKENGRGCGVYACLYNTGRGAAHHPFFLGRFGAGIEIKDHGAFKLAPLRGTVGSIQWLGSNVVIPTGVGIMMSELTFIIKQNSSLQYWSGAEGIEPIKGEAQLPQEILPSLDSNVPLLVNPDAQVS